MFFSHIFLLHLQLKSGLKEDGFKTQNIKFSVARKGQFAAKICQNKCLPLNIRTDLYDLDKKSLDFLKNFCTQKKNLILLQECLDCLNGTDN